MNRFITASVVALMAVLLLSFGLFGAPSGMESLAVLGRIFWLVLILGVVLVVAVRPLRRRLLGRFRLLDRVFTPRLRRADPSRPCGSGPDGGGSETR